MFLVVTAIAVILVAYQIYEKEHRWNKIKSELAKYDDLALDHFDGQKVHELASIYDQIYLLAGDDLLGRLARLPNSTFAILSAWKPIELSIAEHHHGSQVYANDDAIRDADRFIQLVESRFEASPPNWWSQFVREWINPDAEISDIPYRKSSVGKLFCPNDTRLEIVEDKLVYSSTAGIARIPLHQIDSDFNSKETGVCIGFSDSEYFATFFDTTGCQHRIDCYQEGQVSMKWANVVCGCNWGGNPCENSSSVSIRCDKKTLSVFGASSNGFYAQQFNKETGVVLITFSTKL